jgi:hypothetical protein
MNEPLKRRNLLAVPSPSPLPEEAIAAVAVRNGFPSAAPPIASTASVTDSGSRRRQRQPTGREHQFNVRLRQETLDFIYGQANERNIPIAQVIEEMVEALKRAQQR